MKVAMKDHLTLLLKLGNGGFHKWGYPNMDGLEWKIPFKWMIWGYRHLWKPPNGLIHSFGRAQRPDASVFFPLKH